MKITIYRRHIRKKYNNKDEEEVSTNLVSAEERKVSKQKRKERHKLEYKVKWKRLRVSNAPRDYFFNQTVLAVVAAVSPQMRWAEREGAERTNGKQSVRAEEVSMS